MITFPWQHIDFANGSNPYISITPKNFKFMWQHYQLKPIRQNMWEATAEINYIVSNNNTETTFKTATDALTYSNHCSDSVIFTQKITSFANNSVKEYQINPDEIIAQVDEIIFKTTLTSLSPEELYPLLTAKQKTNIHHDVELEWAINDVEQFFDENNKFSIDVESEKRDMSKNEYLCAVAKYYLTLKEKYNTDDTYSNLKEAILYF